MALFQFKLTRQAVLLAAVLSAPTPSMAQVPASAAQQPEPSMETLLAQVADTTYNVRWQARQAVQRKGAQAAEAEPMLLRMLQDPRPHARIGAVEVLLDMATAGHLQAAPVPALLPALDDPDADVRATAARALGELAPTDPSVVAALRRSLLTDSDRFVRGEATWWLGSSGDPNVLPLLLHALQDSTTEVQRTAMRVLLRTDPTITRLAIPELQVALRHPLSSVRGNAALVLGSLGMAARDAAGDLAGLVTDPDSVVAGIAADALGRIVPRRDQRIIPMVAEVRGDGYSLRPDGRGAFVNAVDSTSVNVCEGINIALTVHPMTVPCGDPQYRPTELLNLNGAGRRYLIFDLDDPVEGSGAERLGIIEDERAQVHAFWKRIPRVAISTPITLPVGEEGLFSDRVELHLWIEGRRHIFQFGPWVQGEFLARPGAIHGEGTSRAQIQRPNETQFRITAPAGSIGRLWDMSDRANPVDRGLYRFSFDILWEMVGNP
jgi:HEAT repeat protein